VHDNYPKDGVFIFYCREIAEPCKYDNWVPSMAVALEHCEKDLLVPKDGWISEEEIRRSGVVPWPDR